ncbi:MAG TPA: hypothetical protein VGW35_10800 [Methylomirabilota bacterium]|jgi:hypothetical protein|nr:hypothetical protein [Methylomirabilota bacterium]
MARAVFSVLAVLVSMVPLYARGETGRAYEQGLVINIPQGSTSARTTVFAVSDILSRCLVIEHVSADAGVPIGQTLQVWLITQIFGQGYEGFHTTHTLVAHPQGTFPPGVARFSVSQPIRARAGGTCQAVPVAFPVPQTHGPAVMVQARRSGFGGTATVQVALSGYFVNQ